MNTIKESPVHPYFLTRQFHRAFNHPTRDVPLAPSAFERLLRVKLVLEEACEFARASGYDVQAVLTTHCEDGITGSCDVDAAEPHYESLPVNVVEAADALADLNVVVNGSALVWGFPMPALDWEVYGSNMSKLGTNGKPIMRPDGKIVKGPNYRAPDCRRVLLDYGWKEV